MADEFVIGTEPDRVTDEAYAEAASRLVRYLRGVGFADPEDIAQEAILRAVRDGIRPTAWGWLKQVARRIAIDEHRKRRTVPIGGMADLEADGGRFPSAEDGAMDGESLRIIDTALKALPARYREALLVSARNEGRGIGAELELTGPAARSLLYRARARFRAELERLGYALVWVRDFVSPSRDQLAIFCVVVCTALVRSAPSTTDVTHHMKSRDVRSASAAVQEIVRAPLREANVESVHGVTDRPIARSSVRSRRTYGAEVCVANADGEPKSGPFVKLELGDDGKSPVTGPVVQALDELQVPEEAVWSGPNGRDCE